MRKEGLIPAFLTALVAVSLLLPLVLAGPPSFELGEPSTEAPSGEVNEELAYLIWEDRFPDMLAQATLVVLAATASISAIRLWREVGK
ncbi:hypothetical protein DRO32_02975 [Candidatus Bathyarchaeota archaeon]|nr:MAG: hypothetical protein DRO32_02975 [Candidatus Bathyarchaeota archaeon]